jgi:hypothetical protein
MATRQRTTRSCGLFSLRPDGELGFDGSICGSAESATAAPDDGEASTRWDHHSRHAVLGACCTAMGAATAPPSHPSSRDPRELRGQHDGWPGLALARSDVALGVVHERLRVLRRTGPERSNSCARPGGARRRAASRLAPRAVGENHTGMTDAGRSPANPTSPKGIRPAGSAFVHRPNEPSASAFGTSGGFVLPAAQPGAVGLYGVEARASMTRSVRDVRWDSRMYRGFLCWRCP